MAKCQICKEKFKQVRFLQKVCLNHSAKELADHGREKRKEIKDKEHKKLKREFYDNDIKTRKAGAKKACHDYIRARDKGKLCPCCNEPLGDTFHAGHFLESGNNPAIRYDEDNIHGQRVYCNTFRGGNPVGYEKGLRERIGDKRVDRLFSMKGDPVKRTAEDYKEIEQYYKQKLKNML